MQKWLLSVRLEKPQHDKKSAVHTAAAMESDTHLNYLWISYSSAAF